VNQHNFLVTNKCNSDNILNHVSIHQTLRVRVKDKHAKMLSQWAFEVNQVWNAANELTEEYGWVSIPELGYVNLQTSLKHN